MSNENSKGIVFDIQMDSQSSSSLQDSERKKLKDP
jgi:hypothetical protein